jgi:hypothetical protein
MSQAYLVLICKCGCREVLTPEIEPPEENRVLLAVANSGWRMTVGTSRYDTCPRCLAKPKRDAQRRVLDTLRSILIVRQQAIISEWIGRGST